MKHANISVFVPHFGCPNRCSFCDQNAITNVYTKTTSADVISAVETAKKSKNYNPQNTELAFFGGSFTAIDFDYMCDLLKTGYEFVKQGDICGIRVSTRPDAINENILKVLKTYGVTAIELGAQSTNNEVLDANLRGHTFDDVKNACKLIKESGFSLGLQMMTGLYKSTNETDIQTALDFCELKPDTVRIYPTITLKNTYLATLYEKGLYKPSTVNDAAEICCDLIEIFNKNNISVIRLGLHTINGDSYIAGPWHPAFSEICSSRIYFKKIKEKINEQGSYIVFVNDREISKAVGQNKSNITLLKELGINCKIVGEKSITVGDIKVLKEV